MSKSARVISGGASAFQPLTSIACDVACFDGPCLECKTYVPPICPTFCLCGVCFTIRNC